MSTATTTTATKTTRAARSRNTNGSTGNGAVAGSGKAAGNGEAVKAAKAAPAAKPVVIDEDVKSASADELRDEVMRLRNAVKIGRKAIKALADGGTPTPAAQTVIDAFDKAARKPRAKKS